MNRQQWRMLQAEAGRLAPVLASTCLDYTPDGRQVPVRDDRAVKALERGFFAMLRGGGEPLVVEITEEAALAFPCGKGTDPSAGHRLRPWLAVGLDVTGRGTYSLRWLAAVGLDRAEERDWAEVTMLAQLAAQMQIPGFPSRAHAGRDG